MFVEWSKIRSAEGHVVLKDKATGEILVDKKNAIHFGNLSVAVAQSLANIANSQIRFVVYGNGGTSVNGSGNVVYKTPNTGLVPDLTAAPYNPTYFKDLSVQTSDDYINVVPGTSNYTDIIVVATLETGEPTGQDAIDNATTKEAYVFDEIALYNGSTVGSLSPSFSFTPNGRLLTHVIFHPVQKSLNRVIELDYTLRIQMS